MAVGLMSSTRGIYPPPVLPAFLFLSSVTSIYPETQL
jgi:hypothetical protein